jgi:hypothetical protein
MLRDDYGDVALIVSQKPCPNCGAQSIQLGEPKPSLPVQIATAIREANLSPSELTTLARVVRDASPETSPRELADRAKIPAAENVISVASRAGKHWIGLLGLLIAVVAIYISHTDAEQAHQDAEQAIRQAHLETEQAVHAAERTATRPTGALTEDQVQKIAEQIGRMLEDKK